jgi:hypothetical protein
MVSVVNMNVNVRRRFLVDEVPPNPLLTLHSLDGLLVGDTIDTRMEPLVENNVLVPNDQLAVEELGSVACNARDLFLCMARFTGRVDADYFTSLALGDGSDNEARMRGSSYAAHDQSVEYTPMAFSCSASSTTRLVNPSPPRGWSDAPAGM